DQSPSARAPHRSSTASTRARASERYSSSARLAVEVLDSKLAGVLAQNLLDLRLGHRETLARLAQPLHPFFEQLERLVEIQVFGLEPPHDLLEPLQLAREAGLLGRHDSSPVGRAAPPAGPSRRRRRGGPGWPLRPQRKAWAPGGPRPGRTAWCRSRAPRRRSPGRGPPRRRAPRARN